MNTLTIRPAGRINLPTMRRLQAIAPRSRPAPKGDWTRALTWWAIIGVYVGLGALIIAAFRFAA